MVHLRYNFRKKVKLKGIFQKLVISNIIVIVLILLISSQVMYSGYKNQIIQQSGAISQKLMDQGEYYSNYMLGWARSYIYQLYLDQDILKLMFNKNADKTSIGMSKIKQSTFIQSSIESIYVYNNATKLVYPSDGDPEFFTIYDSQLEDLLKTSPETMSASFIPRKVIKTIGGNKYERNVLTVILKDVNASFSNLPYGAIILNLDANTVQNYFRNISQEDYSIFAVDNNGRMVFNSDKGMFLKDVSSKDYIKKVIESANPNGSFKAVIDDKPAIVSYKTSNFLNMKFVCIIPFRSLTGSINKMIVSLVVTSVLLLLAGVIAAVLLLKRVYSPVDRTFKTLRNYLSYSNPQIVNFSDNSEDEADYLSNMVNIIVHQPLPTNRMLASDFSFFKKMLLTGLIFNTHADIEGLKSKLEELEAKISFNNIAVILFRIDSPQNYDSDYMKEDYEKLKSVLYKDVQSTFESEFKYEFLVTDEDEFTILININEEDQNLKSKLLDILRKYQEDMYSRHSVDITISIGDTMDDIDDTSVSYRSAEEYINYRLKYGTRAILYKTNIQPGINDSAKYSEDVEESFIKELKAGNSSKVKQHLDEIFELIGSMPYNNMVLSISRLKESTKRVLDSMLQMRKSDLAENLGDLMTNFDKLQTLDEKKQYLLNLSNDVINEIKEKKKSRKNEVIENIIGYVGKNYEDPLLTPDTIAESMNLSPNYLRVLFKESEGKSISNYISEVRFEKAKLLLETTDLTIVDISQKVGIVNHNYFYTAFKKYYGISPNFYRNSLKND